MAVLITDCCRTPPGALAGPVWGDLSAYPEPLSRDAQTLGFSKVKLLHQVLSRGFNVVTAEPETVFVHEVAGVFERWFEGSAADMAAATHETASGRAGHTMVDFGAMAVLSRNSTIAMFKEMADKTVNLGWTAEDAFNNMAFDYWSFCHTRSTCWAARRAKTHGGAGGAEKVALAPLPWLSSNYSSCLRPLGDTFCSNRRLFLRGLCVEVDHRARLSAAPPCALCLSACRGWGILAPGCGVLPTTGPAVVLQGGKQAMHDAFQEHGLWVVDQASGKLLASHPYLPCKLTEAVFVGHPVSGQLQLQQSLAARVPAGC